MNPITINPSPYWWPILITIALIIWGIKTFYTYMNKDEWFDAEWSLTWKIFLLPVVWGAFFAVMYFAK